MSQSFSYPSLMYPSVIAPTNSKTNVKTSSLDVAVLQDNEEDGYNNAGLEIYNEFVGVANRELINRELVNLENANVNIDNSSDVIIGPVTQFNVNGNVTIYQGKDGQPVGIDENTEIPNGSCKDFGYTYNGGDSNYVKLKILDFMMILKKYSISYISCLLVAVFFILAAVQYVNTENKNRIYRDIKIDDITDPSNCKFFVFHREDWGGIKPSSILPRQNTIQFVIIKHTGRFFCETEAKCKHMTKRIQREHISKNYSDIAYNFLIGGDGNIYVGRGFDVLGENVTRSLDIAIHGHFYFDQYYEHMIRATKVIVDYGLETNLISGNFSLLCHNQTLNGTDSPGRNIYKEVITWRNYNYDWKTYFNYHF